MPEEHIIASTYVYDVCKIKEMSYNLFKKPEKEEIHAGEQFIDILDENVTYASIFTWNFLQHITQ